MNRTAGVLLGLCTSVVGCAFEGPLDVDVAQEYVGPTARETSISNAAARSAIAIDRELFITATNVVDDPLRTTYARTSSNRDEAGSWSIGRLFRNMLPAAQRGADEEVHASRMVLEWLRSWETDQVVNGYVVPGRPAMRGLVTDPWRLASGCGPTVADADCRLDFTRAPFRLLSIVYRPDLRSDTQLTPEGTVARHGQSGEGRFVWGVLGPQGEALAFTIIFEYGLYVDGGFCIDHVREAQEWHRLGSPSGNYNHHLYKRTREFTQYDAAPWRVNGSALNQIRTNEVALGAPWEMREFVLDPTSSRLRLDPVKQEPDLAYNATAELSSFVHQNRDGILSGDYVIPPTWLAGSSIVRSAFKWTIDPDPTRTPEENEAVRHRFALNTCGGCHRTETRIPFVHVSTREAGQASTLSVFLAAELAEGGPRVSDFESLLEARHSCPRPPRLGHSDRGDS